MKEEYKDYKISGTVCRGNAVISRLFCNFMVGEKSFEEFQGSFFNAQE